MCMWHDTVSSSRTVQNIMSFVGLTTQNIPLGADSRLAPSQWETSLQSNAVSHWLGANLESALPAQIARFIWPTWGPPGSWRPLVGPTLAPWILLSGCSFISVSTAIGLTELGLGTMAVSGYLTNRFGERPVCLMGLTLYGTSSFCLWLSTHYMEFHSQHCGFLWAYYSISGE